MSTRTRITAAAAAVLILGGSAAGTAAVASPTTAPASASSSDARTSASAADRSTSAAAAGSYYLKFDKNQRNQTKSTLYLMKSVSGPDRVIKKYRAGSGVAKNSCTRFKGWLPNGTYDIKFHQKRYNGSLIKGYVIKISDKRCSNGTLRNDLFIHSEMTRNGGQGSTEAFRWDGASDYKSSGCIKLKPADIKNLFSTADSRGWPKKLTVVS
ncbi:L,D-transpeptidase [Streptomyces sp. NPDC005407]|uniref:L,D-transpeptidase n=1 Tax=Streptomyces sp. NPDC005407 TaxID=3155340 RepID=UPI0033B4737D